MNDNNAESLDMNLLEDLFSKGKDPEQRFEIMSNFSRELMPGWFLPMLDDKARNSYYRKMLSDTVKDKVVIDLGSGTGMWSIEALSRGAKFVYVVERNPILVKYLELIFKDHPVKVIAKSFEDLEAKDFDHGAPEALVHEIFSDTGLGEGLISAFQKVIELFPNNSISLFPRYFWFEARVLKVKPLELSAQEAKHLEGKTDAYYELIYSLGTRQWQSLKGIDFSGSKVSNLMFLDLKDIEKNKSYELAPIAIDISPGLVHQVFLSFKFSTELTGPFFDTLVEENHWGGHVVEFYIPNDRKSERKNLKMALNDNQLFEFPRLVDQA